MHKQAAGYCSSWLLQCNHKAGEKWGKWEGHHPQPYHSGLQQQREGPVWALSDRPLNQEGKCRGFKEEQVKQWDKTEHTTPSSCGHLRQAPTKPGCKGRELGCSEGCKVRALHRCTATASRRWTPEDNQYTNFLGCSHSFSCNTGEKINKDWNMPFHCADCNSMHKVMISINKERMMKLVSLGNIFCKPLSI